MVSAGQEMRDAPARRLVQAEFFGLPGSGKTTMAHALHDTLRARDPGIVFAPEITRDNAAGLPRTLARLMLIGGDPPRHRPELHVLGRVAATAQRSGRDKAKSIFNLLTVMSLFGHLDRAGRSAVIDQGILQAAWSVHLRAGSDILPEIWTPLLARHSTEPRTFVCVETPIGVCIERLASRKGRHSRMQSGRLLHDPVAWDHAEAVRRRLTGILARILDAQAARHRLIVVDGTADPRESAAAVAERLERAAV